MIYLATSNGVVVANNDLGNWSIIRRGLEGKRATSILVRGSVLLAGTTKGIYRSGDEGRTWSEASQGLSLPHIRWLGGHPDLPDFFLAGTEPAGLFVSWDGGDSWHERPEVSHLRDQHGWYLPYSPEAGCVRGFALHGWRAYAAVEVGGVLASTDRGATWHMAEGSSGDPELSGQPDLSIHPDLHSIEVHPSSPDLVFAPTGGGFFRSRDGGKTWALLYDCYCRAVWVDPHDPNHLVLGPADSVDSNGRIEQTRDGGETWQNASSGLKTPWRRHMVERFTQAGKLLLAVLSNGQLIAAPLSNLAWETILPDLPRVNAAAASG